ncbi:TIGR00266 family protein [Leptolyngbya ohadii]|uniref:TIGR00266 family protein n=1 Tax=Leptolyngbya ohadii TaxID=1962290 RepID=UPI000B59EA5C|nr:TIGR00266 family protein [Leptolyngbya ohadii]
MTSTKRPTNSDFAYQIEHAPAYASLSIDLRPGQTLLVESGAMAAMDSHIQMKSKVKGGLMKGIGRMLGGESLFLSEFTAVDRPGELVLSPKVPGDIQYYRLDGSKSLMVQSSGFVAASSTVQLDTQFQGAKGFFSGESLFLLRASGTGDLWFSSYGGILEIPVSGEYLVDTGYIVAFEETLQYKVEMLGGLSFKGLKTGILGGEGLVCRLRGTGKLWIQSRQLYPLINFLHPFRPVRD